MGSIAPDGLRETGYQKASQKIRELAKKFESQGIHLDDGNYSTSITFRGDASQAEQVMNNFATEVRKLTDDSKDENFHDALDNILTASSESLSKNKKVLDDYQERYNDYLEMDLFGKGTTKGKPAGVFNDYVKAVDDYNNAIVNIDDADGLKNAKDNFNNIGTEVDNVLKKYPEYTPIFKTVEEQLNKTAIAGKDFNDALTGEGTSKKQKEIKELADTLKSQNLSDIDFQNGFQHKDDTINAIIDKAKQLGVIADTSDESIHALTNSLIEAGIISGEVVENLTVAAKSFEDAKNNTNDLSQSLGNAYGMVADQTTGKSISLNDFNDKSVKDYTSALEYNNGALQINAKKVKELTKAKVDEQIVQNDSAKLELQSQYLKNAGTIEDYSNALKGAKETVLDGKTITQDMLSSLQTSNNSIANQCDQLDILSASLREATGEYQAWLDAQSGAESGDMFRNALEAQQAIRDVVDSDSDSYDKVGTKKYKAAVDFIIPDSVDNEDDVAVQHYLDSIGYAFTKNEEGAIDGLNLQGFLDTAAKQGLMEVDGDNYQVKGQQTMDSFAKGMNMSLPLVRAIFGELEEYGGEFSWADEAVSTLGDLGIKANKAADAIRGVAGNENMQIQLDVSDLDNTTDKISALDNTITQMEEYKQVHVDASSVEQANSIIQYCVAQEQQLTQPAIMTVDASQVEGEMGQVISKLQELKSTTNDKEIQASVGADTSQADAKINGLVDEIQQMNPDIMAKLNIDTSSADTIISSLGAQTPELMAKCNLDSSAVDNYVAPPKDATVTYGVDHSAVDAYDPSNLKRTVTYTVTTKGTPPSGDGSANGTAHAHGTTHAPHIKGSGFNDGNWGLDKSETALTGELGQELVVRDGRFFTIGDHGAEFVSLKKGDIVFNHLQTQALLSKGYVTGRGNLVGSSSFANGTALVTGGIKKRNAKKVSASKKKTTKKKTTPKKTTSSKKSSSSKSSSSNAKKSTPKSGSSKSSSSSQKDFEDKIDWIEVNLQRLGEAIDEFVNMADNYYSGYISQNKMLDQAIAKTKESIANHESGYNYYMQQANAVGISEDWKNKVRNGQINIDTIKDEDLSKKVGEFKELYEKAIEVRKEIIELNAQIQKLNLQKLDNVEESFDAFTNTAKQIHDGFNALNELLESQGKRTSWTNTLEMLGQKGSAETSLRGEVEQLRTLENQMLANGSMKKWSKEYYELETRIIGVQQRLYETQAEEYKLREELRKIQWRPFEDAIEKIDALNDELDDTLDLIKDLDAFSKESGMMNSNGLAQLGLLTQSLGNARQAVENYNIAFEALNTELQNGNINQDQYNTQLQDLKERQRDAVSDVKKYRDAIVDLIKDGIEAETDAMSKLVDKQKDNLRAQKDADDYARTMRDKTKEINKIQAQIAALEGDDSASAKSKVRDLKNQLKEAQQDLEDTQKDHKYDELNKGYDDAMDKFKETQDKEVDLLNSSLEEQTKAIQDMLNSAKNQYATTYDELEELADTYGFHLSEDLANPWKTAANAVDAYNKAVGNVTANGIPATGKVPGLNGGTNNVTYAENNPSAPDNNVKANQQANANKGLVSGGSGLLKSGNRGQAVTNLQNALNGLGYNAGKADGIFGNNTKNALIRFQKDSGISADGIVGNNTRSKFAARGYRMGGVTKKEWAFMDEVGLGSEFVITPNGVMGQFNSGNTIFDPEQTNFLYNVSKNHTLNPSMPDMSQAYASFAARSPSFGHPEVNVNIENIEGNFDESILPQFKKIAAGEYDRKMARWERDRRNDARELGHR